jgi:hypothetical protein
MTATHGGGESSHRDVASPACSGFIANRGRPGLHAAGGACRRRCHPLGCGCGARRAAAVLAGGGCPESRVSSKPVA